MDKKGLSLTGNQLKLIALVTMTMDHVGLILFPQAVWLRVVGRISFPIFAYMIGEGCAHTRSRGRYLGKMAALALTCQIVYYLVCRSMYQNVMVTFSLSAGLIFLLEHGRQRDTTGARCLALAGLTAVCLLTELLPRLLSRTDFQVDYGLWGVMLPVLVYFGQDRRQKLAGFTLGLVLLSLAYGGIQWFCLAAVIPVLLYNGRRGKRRMKNLFYIYYPAHLAVLYFVEMLL